MLCKNVLHCLLRENGLDTMDDVCDGAQVAGKQSGLQKEAELQFKKKKKEQLAKKKCWSRGEGVTFLA